MWASVVAVHRPGSWGLWVLESGGYSLVEVHGLLIVVASLVAKHRL